MLLPSDVARLVLGYLQEEGLSATSQAFIHESPNLKEYADHTIGDGTIPACVFSVFGKGLTTILNEYVATRAKESCHEVPVVLTSLWKKLDFTLNQIKSLQNSPVVSACQRTRSRIGLANMARQRVLTVASSGTVVCSSVSETSSIISPAHTSHSALSHSTPVSYTGPHTRSAPGSGTQQPIHDAPRDSPVQMIVSEHRLNPGPMSPGRRKWDTPRKRAGAGAGTGSSTPGRYVTTSGGIAVEPQLEEAVDESFPQLVIQSARDKILGDRSLQEKLAENINKILASDPIPQTSKASASTVEADQSIDEILGLQGEIHMSDDAIHDILEQTESDPAFQALYDLFDYNKTKFTDGEPGDGDNGTTPEQSEAAGPFSVVRPLQNDDAGTAHKDAHPSDATPATAKVKTAQERKTRKSAAPTLVKKTVLGPSGRSSRIENSSARLLVSQGGQQGASSAAADSNRKTKALLVNNGGFVSSVDIDEPLNTPPPPLDSMDTLEPAPKDATSTTTAFTESTIVNSSTGSAAVPEVPPPSNVDKTPENKQAHGSKEEHAAAAAFPQSHPPAFLPVELDNAPPVTADIPQLVISSSGGSSQPVLSLSATSESASSTSVPTTTPFTASPDSPKTVSTSATLSVTTASSPHALSAPSSLVSAAPDPPVPNPTTPSKCIADSSIVSLKIIISDNQDEDSSRDLALTQAVSSISGDKIPTIYLSSPAKSPGVPGTPKANLDEAALAVSGLQSSELHASPLSCKTGALVASPLTGTSQVQPNYIIQFPLDTTTSGVQGAPASYFLVTEPSTADAPTRQVLLSQGQAVNQYGVPAHTNPQGFSAGSALILPSPAKPVVLPVSVVGQNTVGRVQMVSNQLVAVPNAVPVQPSETVKPKSPAVAVKWSTAGTEPHLVGKLFQPVSADNAGQQDAAKSQTHKRILCFDSSAGAQPQTSTASAFVPATNTTRKHNTQTRTRPAILGGNKTKRRVQTVRCSNNPQYDGGFMKEADKPKPAQQPRKDPAKKNSHKQELSVLNHEAQPAGRSLVDASQPETEKKSEPERTSKTVDRKHSHEKDGDGAKPKDSHGATSASSDTALKSAARKEKEESSKKDPAEKASAKLHEGRTEKRAPSQEIPNVTANKENEIKGSMQEQQSTPSSSAAFSPQAVPQPISNLQSKTSKAPSKTSSLAKQAAEMLHDIQALNSPSTPVKRAAAGTSDLSPSGRNPEESADGPRTPSRLKKGKEGEGTPKHLMPPNTPDIPTCSPASETGSENSINMAAHTLMILSRAAIARTGTPLKDSLRQEGVGEKSPVSLKTSKKRKLSSPTTSPPTKKERERKKLVDCFPLDLDVDKFLSSLHYDE